MKKEQIGTEILKILTQRTKDLPRNKRYLYSLICFLFLFTQYMIVSYMFFFLSDQWSFFLILAVIYSVVLVALAFFLERKVRGEQHGKFSWCYPVLEIFIVHLSSIVHLGSYRRKCLWSLHTESLCFEKP